MKKVFILILSIILLCSCGKKEEIEYDQFGNAVTADPVSNDEKIIKIINQVITDYNENNIDSKQSEWNVILPSKPLDVDEIPLVDNIDQLTKTEDNTTNADYIYLYDIGNYQMKFKLYSPFNEFYLDGDLAFLTDIDKVTKDNKNYTKEKKLLDTLLAANNDVLNLLYGLDVEIGNESKYHSGYYEFVSYNNQKYTSINQIKEYAQSIYSTHYLNDIYKISFESEDPIYIFENKKLYVRETDTMIQESLPYNTSYILNTRNNNDILDIDILISYGDYPVNEVHRISLVEENGSYKIDNLN